MDRPIAMIDRDFIADAADTAMVDVHEQYRFGQGDDTVCFGIHYDGGDRELRSFFIELATRDSDLAVNLNDACRIDQLGRGHIAYFPGYRLETDE